MPIITTVDDLLARAMRGEQALWPAEWVSDDDLAAVTQRLLYHGIAGLLCERRPLLVDWPAELLDTIHEETFARTMWEMRHRLLIAEVIEALHEAGLPSALLKGTAIAYGHYRDPAHRFRGDSDLLVAPDDLDEAREILATLGWSRPGQTHGPFGDLHYQEIWQYADPAGFTHDIDLHWEVTNSRALRDVLDVKRVLSEAVALSALSRHARRADPVTALIHSCVNRAEHGQSGYFFMDRNEFDPDRLLWAQDLYLQVGTLDHGQWSDFVSRSLATGVAPICADGLTFARRRLNAPVPDWVSSTLANAPRSTRTTEFIQSGGGLGRAWADFKATPGAGSKLCFILARAFPAPSHLRAKYPLRRRWPVGLLYLRRLLEAALKFVRQVMA